ncbi:hypothetical protein EDD18DRAFT_1103677 [Armillaria luteobubalina]|uniref:Uncharacterized protein n=1 Tax=Armillaria luteobubalina TaxID=153913 RepID=A0AA39TSA2_9AGAR|nr:hypothetical protein EDD18DRAFT_1103677 [Armillaria luteobubalina]
MHGKKRVAAFDAFARCHSRYDYTFPATMKLPNEECKLTFLGKFLRADEVHENEDPEEFLLNPESLPFNSEIDKALSPYRRVLHTLMFSPETVGSSSIPAKAWLDIQKKKPPVIHWNGTLSLDDQA